MKTLAPEIADQIRARLGLTVDAMAASLSITSRTWFRWMSGKSPIEGPAAVLLELLGKSDEARKLLKFNQGEPS